MICPKCNSITKLTKNGNYYCIDCKITIVLYSMDFSKFKLFSISNNYETKVFLGINALKNCIKHLISFKFLECRISAICSWKDGKNRLTITDNRGGEYVYINNKKVHAKIYLINDDYTIFSSQNNADSGLIEHAILIKDCELNCIIKGELKKIYDIMQKSKFKIIGG